MYEMRAPEDAGDAHVLHEQQVGLDRRDLLRRGGVSRADALLVTHAHIRTNAIVFFLSPLARTFPAAKPTTTARPFQFRERSEGSSRSPPTMSITQSMPACVRGRGRVDSAAHAWASAREGMG